MQIHIPGKRFLSSTVWSIQKEPPFDRNIIGFVIVTEFGLLLQLRVRAFERLGYPLGLQSDLPTHWELVWILDSKKPESRRVISERFATIKHFQISLNIVESFEPAFQLQSMRNALCFWGQTVL